MFRSLIRPRRALPAIAVAVSLGFGATQAFARPQTASMPTYYCEATGFPYPDDWCTHVCIAHDRGDRGGYCSANGVCVCGEIP